MKETLTQEEGIKAIAEIRKEILGRFKDSSSLDPEMIGMWTVIEYYKRTSSSEIDPEEFAEFYKLVLDQSRGERKVFRSFLRATDYFFTTFLDSLKKSDNKTKLLKLRYNYKNRNNPDPKKRREFDQRRMLERMMENGFDVEFKITAPPIPDNNKNK